MQFKPKNYFSHVVRKLENSETPFFYYPIVFLIIIFFRIFAESFSQQTVNYLNLDRYSFRIDLIHFAFSYIVLAMLLTLFVYYATHENIIKILKVILPSFIILLITPIADILLTHGKGHDILYLLPELKPNILKNFFTFFGDYGGVSSGLRIEIAIGLIAIYFYFREKKQPKFLSFFYTLIAYAIIFMWGSSPFFIKYFLEFIGQKYEFSGELMIHYYLILLFPLSVWCIALINPKHFFNVIQKIQWMFYCGIVAEIIGIMLGLHQGNKIGMNAVSTIFLNSVFVAISIGLLSSFFDLTKEAKHEAYVSLSLLMIYGLFAGIKLCFLLVSAAGAIHLYYMPPFQLKQINLMQYIFIPLILLFLTLCGYLIVVDSTLFFCWELFFIYTIVYFLLSRIVETRGKRVSVF